MNCTKTRLYTSVDEARNDHRDASWRVRVYYCTEHQGYHATNHEKRRRRRHKPPIKKQRNRADRRKWKSDIGEVIL